jgi:hypothetical protein
MKSSCSQVKVKVFESIPKLLSISPSLPNCFWAFLHTKILAIFRLRRALLGYGFDY